ncbi:hypothetical protein Tco_1457923, partial [Tanacetum coccineum]
TGHEVVLKNISPVDVVGFGTVKLRLTTAKVLVQTAYKDILHYCIGSLRRRLLRTRTKDKADVVKDKPTNVVKDKADVVKAAVAKDKDKADVVKAPVAKDKEKVDVVKTPVAKDNDKDKAPAYIFVNDKASDDVVNEIQVWHKNFADTTVMCYERMLHLN